MRTTTESHTNPEPARHPPGPAASGHRVPGHQPPGHQPPVHQPAGHEPPGHRPAASGGGATRWATALWWVHGAVRFALAVNLVFNGAIKLRLGQFGAPDVGGALITLGEMSPAGLLAHMVGFSPLFQFLAGVAEVGAAAALVWRRTALLGGLIAAASLTFVFVLNLGYDMPGKQYALALLVLALIVAAPWAGRLAAFLLGRTPLPAPTRVRLFRGRRAHGIARIAAPAAGLVIVALLGAASVALQPAAATDAGAPAGVWAVNAANTTGSSSTARTSGTSNASGRPNMSGSSTTTGTADTSNTPGTRSKTSGAYADWERVALGDRVTAGRATAQVRLANGSLLTGTYTRSGDRLELSLKSLRRPGQTAVAYAKAKATDFAVRFSAAGDRLALTGDRALSLRRDRDAELLYDRGFSWGMRPDDPLER